MVGSYHLWFSFATFLFVHLQIFCTTRKGVQQTAVFLAKTLHANIIQEEAKMKLNQAVYMVQDIKIQGGYCIYNSPSAQRLEIDLTKSSLNAESLFYQ